MCHICLRNPCMRGCPHEDEGEKYAVCSNCGESIHVGEECTRIEDSYYCESCFDNMSKEDLLELVGGETLTAEMEEPDYEEYDEE